MDYELTYTVPQRTTADTGVDSLTHALEAYVSKRANPVSDALALGAMALIGRHLRTAYAEPRNAAAREGMMLGATQAGHGVLQQLGGAGAWHVPPDRRAVPRAARAVQRDAAAGGDPLRAGGVARPAMPRRPAPPGSPHHAADDDVWAADRPVRRTAGVLNRDLGVPSPQAYGIAWSDWERAMDTMADQALASGSPANNPRVPDKAEIVALYRQVYAGSNA